MKNFRVRCVNNVHDECVDPNIHKGGFYTVTGVERPMNGLILYTLVGDLNHSVDLPANLFIKLGKI